MKKEYQGIVLAIVVAVLAKASIGLVGAFSPYLGQIVSPTIVAILLGIMIKNVIGVPQKYAAGVQFAAKYVLILAIVILGATLNINDAAQLFLRQPAIIYAMAFNICLAFSIAYGLGKILHIDFSLRTFIGGGCSICGGTTISALGPIIRATDTQIAFGLSIVFFLDMFTIVLSPMLGQALQLSPEAFGVLAGTAINDTSSVLAAADIYSKMMGNDIAYETASIVKLTRTSFLILVALLFSLIATYKQMRPLSVTEAGTQAAGGQSAWKTLAKSFPWFIVLFVIMSSFNSFGMFQHGTFTQVAGVFHYSAKEQTPAIVMLFKDLSKFLIIVALAGVGLKCNIESLLKPGIRPILLGVATSAAVLVSSITTIGWILHL